MAKIAIIGSRDFENYALLKTTLESFSPTQIISGGAKGAGVIRNRQIVDHCDQVIAFWDGKSRGTKSSIDYAKKLGKPVLIVSFD